MYCFNITAKDANDQGIISEEATLAIWPDKDRADTPIVNIGINPKQLEVNTDITFTAHATTLSSNPSFSNDAVYERDFDGDGTIDLQTKTNTTTYSYPDSGIKAAKV